MVYGRELWRWHCGEGTIEVALWGGNYKGMGGNYGSGAVGREL